MLRYVFSASKALDEDNIDEVIHMLETTLPEGSDVTMTMADI